MMDVTGYNQMSAEEQDVFRDWVIGCLKTGSVVIDFVKTSGEARSMQCTLDSRAQPYEKKTDRVKKSDPNICPVWDIHNEGWRSFRFDTLTSVTLMIGSSDE
jgi:hypothetical protein